MAETRAKIAFEHIIRKLENQNAYIISLRNQAGISSAVTGLVATFFGTVATSKNLTLDGDFFGFSLFFVLSVLCISASIAFSASVVIHYSNFTFSFNCEKMLGIDPEVFCDDGFYSKYVRDGEWYFEDNERLITDAQSKLWFAMVFGFTQILPWFLFLNGVHDV